MGTGTGGFKCQVKYKSETIRHPDLKASFKLGFVFK